MLRGVVSRTGNIYSASIWVTTYVIKETNDHTDMSDRKVNI